MYGLTLPHFLFFFFSFNKHFSQHLSCIGSISMVINLMLLKFIAVDTSQGTTLKYFVLYFE